MRAPPKVDRRAAQSLVETAVMLPIVLVMASAILDLGLAMHALLQVSGALAEVTKLACINDRTPAQLTSIFDGVLGLPVANRTISITTSASDAALDGRPSATLAVTYQHAWVGFVPWNAGSGLTFSATHRTPVLTNGSTPGGLIPDP